MFNVYLVKTVWKQMCINISEMVFGRIGFGENQFMVGPCV